MSRSTNLVTQVINETEDGCIYLTVDEEYEIIVPGKVFKTLNLTLELHNGDGDGISTQVTPDELIDAGMALLRTGIDKERNYNA